MYKKHLIVLFSLLISIAAQAKDDSLKKAADLANKLNSKNDKNRIATAFLNGDTDFIFTADWMRLENDNSQVLQQTLIDTLKECVFLREGVLEDHFTEEEQSKVSLEFATKLQSIRDRDPKNIGFGRRSKIVLNAPSQNKACALVMTDAKTGKTVMLQGCYSD